MSLSPPGAPRILYIDDDAGLARLVQKQLSRKGYEVAWAPDGDAGLERLKEGGFDVIALDHFMPGREGLDVLETIRATPEAPPVVYVTGAQEGRVAVAALKAGAADYVIKDIGEDFVALLQAAIDHAVERETLRRQKDASDAEVRTARDRAEALLQEVNHRIGNSLQLVSSFIALQSRTLKEESARHALRETQSRIEAIAHVHRRLYTSGDFGAVNLADYLSGLVEELSKSLASDVASPSILFNADPLKATTDKAVSLGVIVAELVTNAVKYAYPESDQGEIRVALTRCGPGRAALTVDDDGQGMIDGPPKGSGLGQTIIRAMASNLKSQLVYERCDRGTCSRLEFDI